MTQARLLVAEALLPVALPAGFSEVWSRWHQCGVVELLIEGPFPPEVDDGALVTAMLTYHGGPTVKWQWCYHGQTVGNVLDAPRMPIP